MYFSAELSETPQFHRYTMALLTLNGKFADKQTRAQSGRGLANMRTSQLQQRTLTLTLSTTESVLVWCTAP